VGPSQWIGQLGRALGRADNLAQSYTLYGDTGEINKYMGRVLSVTAEQVSAAVKKYLSPVNCVVIHYLPKDYEPIG
ncbi:MAG: hypothetical protein M1378_01900, partial [Bacteroidetes bacterium]|nr:hypothetical protein [Bacteroidota bacterium]